VNLYEHYEPNRADHQRRNKSTVRAVVVFNIILILILLAVLYILLGGLSSDTSSNSTSNLPKNQVISSGAMLNPASRIDLAGLVQPLIMIALGWVVGFLGLKRLSQYDDEINRIRESIERQSNNFHGEINRKIESIRSDVDGLADSSITKQIRERAIKLDEQLERINEKAQERIAEIESKLEPYAWLEHRSKDDAELIKSIPSVGFAHKEVTRLGKDKEIDIAMSIGKEVLSNKVRGNSDEYFNLAVQYANLDLYTIAFDIVQLGLEFYHNDIDLLAAGLRYSSLIGEFKACTDIHDRLLAIGKKHWTARSFEYVGDYYMDKQETESAIELMDEFISCFPFDEKGYLTKGAIYEGRGDLSTARRIYEECVQKVPRTPCVSNALAQIYIAMAEYENAINASNKAIEYNTELQPPINEALVYFNRALARDSLIHREPQKAIEDPTVIMAAILDYKLASSLLGSDSGHIGTQASIRIKALQLHALNIGIDLSDFEYSENDMDYLESVEEESDPYDDNIGEDPNESSKEDI
jgi:tetratricopeptide (TPR) repeat protein